MTDDRWIGAQERRHGPTFRPWTDVRSLLDRAGAHGCTRSDVARLFDDSASMSTGWATAGNALRDLLRSGEYESYRNPQNGREVTRYRRTRPGVLRLVR